MNDEQASLPDENGEPIDRGKRIRTLFADLGGQMEPFEFARFCLDQGVFTPEERLTWDVKQAWQLIAKDLRIHDEGKKPFAGPLSREPGASWAQRKLWDETAYFDNVETHVKQGLGNLEVAARLADECQVRFGSRPPVPEVALE